MFDSKEKIIKRKNIFIFYFLVLLLGIIKPPFTALGLSFLFIPRNKFKNQKDYFLIFIGLIITFILVVLYSKYHSIEALSASNRLYHFSTNGTNMTGQLNYMLTHKKDTLLLFGTISYKFPIL